MPKIIALVILIAILGLFTYALEPNFITAYNLSNLARHSALLGIYALGVGMVIISGGIDLSIGSVVALTGYLTTMILNRGYGAPLLFPAIILVGVIIGSAQGILVSYFRLQPFVVTLCGLLIFRGLARVLSRDQSGSLGDEHAAVKYLTKEQFLGLPMPVWILIVLAVAAHLFLSRTVWGRYIYAIGNNEEASLYSGINVNLTKVLTYIICSLLGAFSGILEASDIGSITPSSTGAFYELYAIAAAVLGGCSLRGGEGNVLGILLGAVAIRLIRNVTNILGFPSQWEYAVLGVVILAGALVDAGLERYRDRKLRKRGT